MADSWLILAVRVQGRSATDLKNKITQGTVGTQGSKLKKRFASYVQNLISAVASNTHRGNLVATILDTSATFSTGNIACTRANAAGNYVRFTYGAQTITLTEGTDFLRGASDTTCAANLATAINAHPVLGELFTAAGNVGDCGLTALVPTALLQDIGLSTDDGTAFAFTALTGATEGAAQFFIQDFTFNRGIV